MRSVFLIQHSRSIEDNICIHWKLIFGNHLFIIRNYSKISCSSLHLIRFSSPRLLLVKKWNAIRMSDNKIGQLDCCFFFHCSRFLLQLTHSISHNFVSLKNFQHITFVGYTYTRNGVVYYCQCQCCIYNILLQFRIYSLLFADVEELLVSKLY